MFKRRKGIKRKALTIRGRNKHYPPPLFIKVQNTNQWRIFTRNILQSGRHLKKIQSVGSPVRFLMMTCKVKQRAGKSLSLGMFLLIPILEWK